MTVTEYDRQWQQKTEWQWQQKEIICDLNVSNNDEANLGNDENDSDNDKIKYLVPRHRRGRDEWRWEWSDCYCQQWASTNFNATLRDCIDYKRLQGCQDLCKFACTL